MVRTAPRAATAPAVWTRPGRARHLNGGLSLRFSSGRRGNGGGADARASQAEPRCVRSHHQRRASSSDALRALRLLFSARAHRPRVRACKACVADVAFLTKFSLPTKTAVSTSLLNSRSISKPAVEARGPRPASFTSPAMTWKVADDQEVRAGLLERQRCFVSTAASKPFNSEGMRHVHMTSAGRRPYHRTGVPDALERSCPVHGAGKRREPLGGPVGASPRGAPRRAAPECELGGDEAGDRPAGPALLGRDMVWASGEVF